ncbi:PH domain-containing protein [Peribacillus sp. FSL H8-0477]|uniref:PH domain-containing protein n=1 Tax=Peribacillus sp. FSL H8-0477 TaxID=2921388 RepID=UPI0030FA4278
MYNPKRLHPAAILLMILKILKDAIFPLVLIFLFGGNNFGEKSYLLYLGFGLVILFVIGSAVLTWFRFTYWIENGELRIESGLFVKKKQYIRFERIHSVNISEGLVQRLFGLAKLQIETAGGEQADVELAAINKKEAERIQLTLAEGKREKTPEAAESADVQTESIFQQTFPQLFLMAATSGGVGVVFSTSAAFISQFDEIIPFDKVFSGFEHVLEASLIFITILVVSAFIVAYLIATIGVVLKYGHFTLKKKGEELIISRGLLEKRQITIPTKKIQAIRISENLLRQPLGLASVYIEYAGGSASENAKIMLFPLIKRKDLQGLLDSFVPGYQYEAAMKGLPKRAFSRYLFRHSFFAVIIMAACIWLFRPWGFLSLVLIPLSCLWAYLSFREAGWEISGNQLQVRFRIISKQSYLFHKNRIQSITYSTNWFQLRKSLASIFITAKSGAGPTIGRIKDLEKQDTSTITRWLASRDYEQV